MKIWKLHGRAKPYTQIGINRLPCFRCGKPSYSTWQGCADGGLYRPVCKICDVALNRMYLQFMGFPNWMQILTKYIWSLVK